MIPWVKLNELKKRALNVIDVFLLPSDNPRNPWLLLAYAVSIEPLIFLSHEVTLRARVNKKQMK